MVPLRNSRSRVFRFPNTWDAKERGRPYLRTGKKRWENIWLVPAKESSQTSSLLLLQSRVKNEVQQNTLQVFNYSCCSIKRPPSGYQQVVCHKLAQSLAETLLKKKEARVEKPLLVHNRSSSSILDCIFLPPKGGRGRLIEVAAQLSFNFPFFSITISGLSLVNPNSGNNLFFLHSHFWMLTSYGYILSFSKVIG